MKLRSRTSIPGCIGLLALVLLLAGCGSSSTDNSSSSASAPATSAATASTSSSGPESTTAALGTPQKATGTPYVFGLLNLDTGPVTFPEARQGAQAAVAYVNEYKNGINGHPIQIATCATDGQPATSQSCANQVGEKHPLLILGGADTGSSGSIPVWERDKLAYVGGVPFTPVESNAKDGAIFISLVVSDNAAAVEYARSKLGVKKAAIIYTDDTQGTFTESVIANEMEHAGMQVKPVPVSPTAADYTAPAASAVASSPELVFDVTPNACPATLTALKSVGYTGKLSGIDPCTSPPAIKSEGAAGNGFFYGQPFESLESGSPDAKLTNAILAKYAPARIAVDSPALAGISAVMNIQSTLSKLPGPLTSQRVLAAFRTGANHANFLAHPYTCDQKQVPAQTASCDSYQQIKQIQNGKIVTITGFLTGAHLYQPKK